MYHFQKSSVTTLLCLVFFASFSSSVFARTGEAERLERTNVSPTGRANPTRIQEHIELRQDQLEARAAVVQERQTERVSNRQERRSDFAQQHADRIEHRFALYAEHLFNIANRIETRAQMMSNNGKNTTETLVKVSEARTFITSAQTKGAEAVNKFRSIDPATYDSQRDVALAAKDLAEAAREDYKTARDLLQEAVRLLGSLR